MSDQTLRALGEALANIASTIAECVRADIQNTPSASHVEHFDQCLAIECRRLRGIEQDGLASAIEAIRGPMTRLMTEGW